MPFPNLEIPAETLPGERKKALVDGVTDLFIGVYGDRARSNVRLEDEVVDGGWSIGGQILTKAMPAP